MAAARRANAVDFVFGRLMSNHPRLLARRFLRDKISTARFWFKKDIYSHYGCVNAIEFSSEGTLLVSGGDDRRVLLWKVNDILDDREHPITPAVMNSEHGSNIFCLNLSSDNKTIFSAGNDETVIIHDVETGASLRCYMHEKPVYCISLDPSNDDIFCSASDDGRVLIYDVRKELNEEALILATSTGAYHGVMYNPVEPLLVATANAKQGLSLYDVRKPKEPVVQYGENKNESCMSVRFNQRGTHLLGLRRRREAVLYQTISKEPVAVFDNYGYYNSCTMKSCCFAGPSDEFVLSGSDDFNLYLWKVPSLEEQECVSVTKANFVLSGHRSIVNQVRYNSAYNIIASSGVEKIIKLWSPTQLPGDCDHPQQKQKKVRKMYTHDEYISLVLQSGQFMSHDYSTQNTEEDPRMMAFFDSLVQREVEGWSTDEDGEKINSSMDSEEPSSPDECIYYTMGSRKMLKRRQRLNILRQRESECCDTNCRIALLIDKKRKALTRSRRHLARKLKTPEVNPTICTTISPESPPPNGVSENSDEMRECNCGTLEDDYDESAEESSEEESGSPVSKRLRSTVHAVVPSDSYGEWSRSPNSESYARHVPHQDSGVELNGSSSSSRNNSVRHRRCERKPNKRDGRRRRNDSSSEYSSDSDC